MFYKKSVILQVKRKLSTFDASNYIIQKELIALLRHRVYSFKYRRYIFNHVFIYTSPTSTNSSLHGLVDVEIRINVH